MAALSTPLSSVEIDNAYDITRPANSGAFACDDVIIVVNAVNPTKHAPSNWRRMESHCLDAADVRFARIFSSDFTKKSR